MNSVQGSLFMLIISMLVLCFGIFTIHKSLKKMKEEKMKNEQK